MFLVYRNRCFLVFLLCFIVSLPYCQVTVRIGSPVTGYGQESRNRAARQRIPNRVWTDEDGVEHVEVAICSKISIYSLDLIFKLQYFFSFELQLYYLVGKRAELRGM